MFEFFFYFYIILFLSLLGGIAFGSFYFVRKKRKNLFRSLNFVLYEITLPQEAPKQNDGEFKNFIGLMEQFYSGLGIIGSYFVLEIGLSAKGHEVVFYCAVEKKQSQQFEKLMYGLFPFAGVNIKRDDYNIFRPEGVSLGCSASLVKDEVLPIKIYDKFESDPVQVLINTFSKLQKEGEGAALQIIIFPANDRAALKAKRVGVEIRKGKSLPASLKGEGSFGKEFFRELGKIFFGFANKSESAKPQEQPGNINMDEELAKLVEYKANSKTMNVNMRLLASSENQKRAESILEELKSAFSQFSQANGNSFKFAIPKGKKMKNLFYKFSFRMPDEKAGFELSLGELATIFHFPLGIHPSAAPQLKYLRIKEAPLPLNLPVSGLFLGKNSYRGETADVFMKDEDRRRHFYVIGQTGTGKSVLLKNMIIQDIEAGKGVCFIDPHGSDLQDILARIPESRLEDVIYFNPGDVANPMGLNMLEYDPAFPEQKTFIVNELLGIFNKLFDMKTAGGPMFEQYFRNACLLVMEDPDSGNTLLEIERVLADANFRSQKLSKCSNPLVISFWKEMAEKAGGEASLQNMVPYITSKFDSFLSNEIMRPIIVQEKSAFNFRKIMDEKKILLVNLSKGRLGDLNANLLGLIIVGKILMASLSRVDMPEDQRNDFYLYIDEFQNVTTDSIATILSEARKYRLNLIIAHQFIGQLAEDIKKAVFGNVGSMAMFRVGVEDAEMLYKQLEPVFGPQDLINLDNYYAYLKLLIDGQVARPFSIQTLPFAKGRPEVAEQVARLSAAKYSRLRSQVEAEISQRYNSTYQTPSI